MKSDIASSLHGIESRKPFYTRAIVDLAFRMPGHWKKHRDQEKWIFRQALKANNILPDQLADRPKGPFNSPSNLKSFSRWSETLNDFLESDSALKRTGAIDWKILQRHSENNSAEDRTTEAFYSLSHILTRQKEIADQSRQQAR